MLLHLNGQGVSLRKMKQKLIRALAAGTLVVGIASARPAQAAGWYLMAPPTFPDGSPNVRAPLSQWEQDDTFDSGQDCDEARRQNILLYRHLALLLEQKLELVESKMEALPEEQQNKLAPKFDERLDKIAPKIIALRNRGLSSDAAKCIATDDPRLAK
jgi:hypothetical protein